MDSWVYFPKGKEKDAHEFWVTEPRKGDSLFATNILMVIRGLGVIFLFMRKFSNVLVKWSLLLVFSSSDLALDHSLCRLCSYNLGEAITLSLLLTGKFESFPSCYSWFPLASHFCTWSMLMRLDRTVSSSRKGNWSSETSQFFIGFFYLPNNRFRTGALTVHLDSEASFLLLQHDFAEIFDQTSSSHYHSTFFQSNSLQSGIKVIECIEHSEAAASGHTGGEYVPEKPHLTHGLSMEK